MYHVILDKMYYTPELMVDYLRRLGVDNPLEAIQMIKRKGRGRIGDVRILYLG